MRKDNKGIQYLSGYLEGLRESLWECLDCGNTYESTVDHCPNSNLDQANVDFRYAERNAETTTHDPLCPNAEGPCCPWMGDCNCQCLCDWIREIREDERENK